MAYSIHISTYSGYPTQTSMRVSVSFTVVAAGRYTSRYELYGAEGELIVSSQGTTDNMAANSSSSDYHDDFYKTFTDLTPGTVYSVVAYLVNASTGSVLATSNEIVFATLSTQVDLAYTVYFWDGNLSDSVSGTSSSNPVSAIGPLHSDWEFLGWSTNQSSTTVAYNEGEGIDKPASYTSVDLYAVYRQRSYIYFHFLLPDGADSSQSREKIQYRCNTSKTTSSTNFYNTISMPSFSTANSTVTTETPDRSWSVVGWRTDQKAANKEYSVGDSVSSGSLPMNVYAVYSNTCSVNYNSNGGSGSMESSSDTAYYSASHNYATPTFTIKSSTFVAPTGKKFGRWSVKADGSGTSYYAGSTMPTNHNIILYAIWVAGKPDEWSWTTNVAKDAAVVSSGSGSNMVIKPLTASEWLDFADRIKEFYTYLGKSIDDAYWYRAINGVAPDSPMTKTQANAVRWLINELNPPTSVPDAVDTGYPITAAFINGLKDSLNSIN